MAFVLFPLMIFPMTWLWMFLHGSLGFGYSYWEALPLGIMSVLLLGALAVLGPRSHRVPPATERSPIIRL